MLIQLRRIIDELDKIYKVEISGRITGAITSIERLPVRDNAELDPGTLYICNPSDIEHAAALNDTSCFLCAVKHSTVVDTTLFPKRKVIIVRSESASEVLIKLNEIMYEIGRQGSVSSELLSALVECVSLRALVDIGYRFLKNPIVITDAGRNTLEYTHRVEIDDSVWEDFVTTGQLFVDTRVISEMVQSPQGIMSQALGVVSHESTQNSPHVVQKAIVAQGCFLGYLFIAGFQKDISPGDIEMASLLGNFAAPILLGLNTASKEINSVEGYLETLLELSYNNPGEVSEQIALHDWKPKKHLYVMICGKYGQVAGKRRRDIAREIEATMPDIMSLNYKNGSVFLWETDNLLTENDPRLDRLFILLAKYNTRVGISRSFSSPKDIKKYYFQARKALEMGEIFEKEFLICPYERYSVFHVMELCESYEDLDNFCYPGFYELIEHDKKSDSQLFDTLSAYLKARGSIVKTASDMNIHENTAKYRMKVISKLLNCDLNSGEDFFQLYFTVKAHDFLNKRPNLPISLSLRASQK